MEIIKKKNTHGREFWKKEIAALNLELKRVEYGVVIIEHITELLQSCQSSLIGKKNVSQVKDALRLYFFVTFAVKDCSLAVVT